MAVISHQVQGTSWSRTNFIATELQRVWARHVVQRRLVEMQVSRNLTKVWKLRRSKKDNLPK